MEYVIKFVIKHRTVFIWLGVVWLAYTVWSYFRALQVAKAAGQGVGEGLKGTASTVADIVTAPFEAIAAIAGEVADLVIGNDPGNGPELRDLGYYFGNGTTDFEKKLWTGSAPPPTYDPAISNNPMFRP